MAHREGFAFLYKIQQKQLVIRNYIAVCVPISVPFVSRFLLAVICNYQHLFIKTHSIKLYVIDALIPL